MPTRSWSLDALCEFHAHHADAQPDCNDAALALVEHSLDRNRNFAALITGRDKAAAPA